MIMGCLFLDKKHFLFCIIILICALVPCQSRIAEDLLNKEEIPAPVLPAPVPPPPPPPATTVLPTPEVTQPPAPPQHTCYNAPRELCPETPGCKKISDNSMLCCDADSIKLKEGLDTISRVDKIINLHILNATMTHLNVSQAVWRQFISISITDGNITSIVGEFKRNSPATCFNVSNNGLTSIPNRALVNLFNLTTLDLSQNNLKELPHFKNNNNLTLNIRGNEMLCRSVSDTLDAHQNLNLLNVNTTFCTSSKTFHWFNSTELVPVRQIEVIRQLRNDCPQVVNCSCVMERVDIIPGIPAIFSVGVDCSNRNLKQLPYKLPPNTIQLNVSYNNLTSLAQISQHSSYEHIRELYADYNNIDSIKDLEGTKFIDNFVMLSLKGNKLRNIPTYILSDTLDRNSFNTLSLGYNYLHCDCGSAKTFKFWLIDKAKHIPDYELVFCENKKRIIDLSENLMCQQQRDWTDYIFYIIALEVLLLLGLVTKVSYDYWIFKNMGYLPWPASKMPKLPCDWLCE